MTFGSFRLNTLAAAMAEGPPPTGGTITATGGVVTYYNDGTNVYKVHSYNVAASTYSFVVSAITGSPTVEAFLVGGGGAGGGGSATSTLYGGAGGGGAGQVLNQTGIAVSATSYSIVIGAGGTGVAGAAGNPGAATTGFGFTAAGGGAGQYNAAGTNGGGSGTAATTSYAATAGTYAFKGGNAFGSATTTIRAGGGGAGAGGAGTNATGSTGGAGGAGVSISTFAGDTRGLPTNVAFATNTVAAGGGGGGATGGAGGGGSGTIYGAGATNGGGSSNTAIFGGGGGGSRSNSATAKTGGSGARGVAAIRYLSDKDYVYQVDRQVTTSGATIVIPSTAAIGDFVFLVDRALSSSAIPTTVTPSGWTNIADTSLLDGTVGMRTVVSYKKLVSGDPGSTITGMNGGTGNTKMMLVYRTNLTTATLSSVSQQTSAATISGGTLTLSGLAQPYIGFSIGTAASTYPNHGGTPSSTRIHNSDTLATASSYIQVRTYEACDDSITFANVSGLAIVDGSTQALITFSARFS